MAARAVVHGLRHPTVENAPTLIGLLDRSLARLQEQIDNVLTTDRLETGLDLVPEQFAVQDLVEAVREEAEVEGRLRRIRISTDVSTNLNLRGERRLLQSALTNVVRNAVKFTSEGGTVQIRGREAPNAVMIEVEDECGGLPAGAASVIFEPFVQRGRDRSGFGLGLAIARQAVEAHGGRLLLQDLPGRGCIFRLELPAASARRA
jgi:signal transduction histidine kinase